MTDGKTLRDVNHTHPDHETRDFHWFQRGPAVTTDGGRRDAEDTDGRTNDMRTISHATRDDPGTDRVWDGTGVRERDDE